MPWRSNLKAVLGERNTLFASMWRHASPPDGLHTKDQCAMCRLDETSRNPDYRGVLEVACVFCSRISECESAHCPRHARVEAC